MCCMFINNQQGDIDYFIHLLLLRFSQVDTNKNLIEFITALNKHTSKTSSALIICI